MFLQAKPTFILCFCMVNCRFYLFQKRGVVMEIKAVMCDIDGTLLTDEGIVSSKTKEAIKQLKEKGILFGLCTGRDVHSVKTLLSYWQIDTLVDVIVGTGGAEICDFSKGIEKASYPLKGTLISEIIRHFEDMEVNFAIPEQGILYAPKDDEHIRLLSKFDHVPYQVIDFDEFLKEERAKVMIVCAPETMDAVIERAKTFKSTQYKSASLKTASVLYEYMDPRISKSAGLKKVMELHNLDMKQLCVFGDADNDYDMIVNAGVGVVMANGSEKCKGVSDYITADNNHDGIATFIEKNLL